MINLLPTDLRRDMLYARRNSKLLRWIIVSIVVLFGVGVLVAGGYIYMQQQINNYSKLVESSRKNLESQEVEKTQQKLDEISSNTKLAIQVLSREVLFSKLLRQLGASMPANTELQSLEIIELQGGLTLNAGAADFNAASQLQVNLQDPNNKIFEKADIEEIICSPDSKNRLPCTVRVKALFSKDNPYLYITPSKEGQP